MRMFNLIYAILLLACVTLLPACDQSQTSAAPKPAPDAGGNEGNPPMVTVRVFGQDAKLSGPVQLPKLVLSDAEWKKRLTPTQFEILRAKDTEPPFCGGLLKNKEKGVYACAGCALPLFDTTAKFESGTGWPSFFQPIAKENVAEKADHSHGMDRVEILCARCDGHLGHLFEDGPRPTGLRFCLNSESLRFVAEDKIATLAEKIPATQPATTQPAAAAAPTDRAEVVFAGGCFWCVEAVFEEIDGVNEAISGYAGGTAETAHYQDVSEGNTGHAEVVKIIYDPRKVSYEQLLKLHFATHDPTTLNRQGNDVGTQYRSAIFYASENERLLAKAFIDDMTDAKVFSKSIVTTLEPLTAFYPAESYHQNYACRNPNQPYIRSIALPKVDKVRSKFKDIVKPESPIKAE